jgi:hypothetical protein
MDRILTFFGIERERASDRRDSTMKEFAVMLIASIACEAVATEAIASAVCVREGSRRRIRDPLRRPW